MIRNALYLTMALVVVGTAFSGASVAQEDPAPTAVVTADDLGEITATPLNPETCSITIDDGGDTDKGGGGGGTPGGGGGC